MQSDLFPAPESERKTRTWLKVAIGSVALGALLTVLFLYPSLPSPPPPTSLPIPAGTVFGRQATLHWVAWFNVTEDGDHLVGAWGARDGTGTPALVVVNGTVSKPAPESSCPSPFPWDLRGGSINSSVALGPHTVYWALCFEASKVIVTQAIRLAAGSPPLVALSRSLPTPSGVFVASAGPRRSHPWATHRPRRASARYALNVARSPWRRIEEGLRDNGRPHVHTPGATQVSSVPVVHAEGVCRSKPLYRRP